MKAKKEFQKAKVKRCRERTLYLYKSKFENAFSKLVLYHCESSRKFGDVLNTLLKDVPVDYNKG